MTSISVVGSSGRVGRALLVALADEFDVAAVHRIDGEPVDELAARAAADVAVVVNAAGVAHVERVDVAAIERLRSGNVALPAALARAALASNASVLHISSTKAREPETSPYASSKRDGEIALEDAFGAEFERAGRSIVVMRPPAMLFPPLDAGKVARLRFLGRVPARLVPPVRLPVLPADAFVQAVRDELRRITRGDSKAGYSIREFAASEHGTLRDVALAFSPHPRARRTAEA